MEGLNLTWPLVINVYSHANPAEVINATFFKIDSILSIKQGDEIKGEIVSNGWKYTTVVSYDDLCRLLKDRIYAPGADGRNESFGANGQKKSSACALYLIQAGRAVIDERGDLVDESEYPHGLRVRKDALVGTAPLYPTISTRFDPAELSGPVSNTIKCDARNMMMRNKEFLKRNIESMSKEREEEIDKWIESDSPVKITGSAKDRAALEEIDRVEESFMDLYGTAPIIEAPVISPGGGGMNALQTKG